MATSLTLFPNPLEVGQGFNVYLHVDATEAKQGDKYTLVITDPSAPVVIDIHMDEITTLKPDGSADLTFESVNGFQAIGRFTFFAVNESDPLNPIPSTQLEFDVVLPAPIPAPAPAPALVSSVAAPVLVPVPVPAAIAGPAATPQPTPSVWRCMKIAVSWAPGIALFLTLVVIGMAILLMPAWAVWLISKNGNSQHGQVPPAKVEYALPPGALEAVKGLLSGSGAGKGGEQTINPVCISNCTATGNLFNPGSAASKP